jgi:16S rRNA G966 N2-methylase RsmD
MTDGIRLIRGNGVKWLRDQPPMSLDGIFTDPPWGAGPAIVGQARWKELIHEMSIAGYRALKPGGRLLIWIGINRMDGAIREVSRRFVYSGAIVIRTIPPTCRGRWVLGGDHVLIYGKAGYARPVVRMAAGEMTLPSLYGNFTSSGIRSGPDTSHPCARDPRPATIIARQWFKPNEHVADPFGGSAVIACALGDCGVRATSIEVDPKMHKTALTRVGHRTMNVFRRESDAPKDAPDLLGMRQGSPGDQRRPRRPRREVRPRSPSRVH